MNAKLILVVLIFLFAVIFTFQNTQIIEIKLLFWNISAIRAVVLAIVFSIGVLTGFLINLLLKKRPDKQHNKEAS